MADDGRHDEEPETTPVPDSQDGATREQLAPPSGTRGSRFGLAFAGVVLAAVAAIVGVVVVSTTPTPSSAQSSATATDTTAQGQAAVGAQQPDPVVAPLPVSDADLGALPQANTFGTVPDAPHDDDPAAAPSGRLVHPAATVPVYLAPGEKAIAALPAQQLQSDTWLPVIAEQPGWVRVLLPTRPGGSTGWLYLDDPRVSVARTTYRVVVDRAAFTLTLLDGDRQVGRWTVGVGKPNSVTPQGRTFVMASIKDTHPTFSPIILPLGTHSDTYTSYGGGPGTVGIHTWPSQDVYGKPSSDGCIRVPPDALGVLSTQVPIGTPVLIS